MKSFFEYFPAKLTEKMAMCMIHEKMHEAYKAFKKAEESEGDSEYYLECLEKVKDMITIYLKDMDVK